MKRLLYILFILSLLLCQINSLKAQSTSKVSTVVIDAGHGGKDPGAIGSRSKEKDIALAVALKTGHYIETYLPDVKVIYTRKDDRFIPLYQRAEIANKNKADFFISIHCNSNNNKSASGSETYTMGLHKNNANLNVAMLENAAIVFEDDANEQYGNFDANSDESYIQFNLFQGEYQEESNLLAYLIQDQFKTRVGRKDRGVHQAGFLVLWRTAMPGVLIELGFISNSAEENFLLSDEGQSFMASAIYRAFKKYKLDYEQENEEALKQSAQFEKTIQKPEILPSGESLNYRIQFYTSPIRLKINDTRFKGIQNIYVYEHNGQFKYTSGMYATSAEAQADLSAIRKLGFADAFVIPFKGEKRISFDEAKQLEMTN